MGKFDLRTVIVPSGYARSRDLRISNVIKGLIGRSLDVFLRKRGMTVKKYLRNRGMTFDTVILGQQRVTRVSKDVKWTLGSSPRVTGARKSPRVTGEEERPWVTIGLIFLGSVSMATMARAECVPTPDCASIGYTATSCDGGFVRCPFNTSKLLCIPCDTSFQYACNGEGETGKGETCNGKYQECACDSAYKYTCSGTGYSGGSGTVCGGKYQSCTCSSGYEWNGSACTRNCNVGYIYYSDKSCSSSYNSSKTVAGIVVKKNKLVMSKPLQMQWGNNVIDVSGLTDIEDVSIAQADMKGKSNTSTIVSYHTSIGESTSTSAALYCNSYTGGISGTSGKWYLPAEGELYTYVYGNYSTLNPVATTLSWSYFSDYWFWSSSENSDRYAWIVNPTYGYMYYDSKGNPGSVSCLLEIS